MSEAVISEVRSCLETLERDRPKISRLSRYIDGKQDPPYIPDHADAEFKQLAKRSITNVLPLLIDSSAQALYVDDYRAPDGEKAGSVGAKGDSAFWLHWQASRLDARQSPLWRSALGVGQSFVLTEKQSDGEIRSRALSPSNTTALFEWGDWLDPRVALTVTQEPSAKEPGKAYFWDHKDRYEVTFKRAWRRKGGVTIGKRVAHGAKRCPVTRISPHVDVDGNAVGIVEPLMPLQDRINQSVFDLLIAQTYTSFEVRTVTGMAPPMLMELDVNGEPTPKLDANGQPMPDRTALNARRMLFAEDSDVKFSSLPGGNLSGIIEAIDTAFRHFCAIGQIPPHYILGEIVNVNAEALKAAGVALERKNSEIAASFGEAIERIDRVFREIAGKPTNPGDFGEVIWRDLSTSSLAQTADALGKLAESLGIPKQGLWSRVPNVTRQEREDWERLAAEAADGDWQTSLYSSAWEEGAAASSNDSQQTSWELSRG